MNVHVQLAAPQTYLQDHELHTAHMHAFTTLINLQCGEFF